MFVPTRDPNLTQFLTEPYPIFSFTSGATISIELATGFFMTDFLVIVLLFKHYGKKQFFQFFAHHSVSIIAFSLVLYHKGKDLLIIWLSFWDAFDFSKVLDLIRFRIPLWVGLPRTKFGLGWVGTWISISYDVWVIRNWTSF